MGGQLWKMRSGRKGWSRVFEVQFEYTYGVGRQVDRGLDLAFLIIFITRIDYFVHKHPTKWIFRLHRQDSQLLTC